MRKANEALILPLLTSKGRSHKFVRLKETFNDGQIGSPMTIENQFCWCSKKHTNRLLSAKDLRRFLLYTNIIFHCQTKGLLPRLLTSSILSALLYYIREGGLNRLISISSDGLKNLNDIFLLIGRKPLKNVLKMSGLEFDLQDHVKKKIKQNPMTQ